MTLLISVSYVYICNNADDGGLRLLRFTLTDLPFLRPSSPLRSKRRISR